MQDAVTVALEGGTVFRLVFRESPAARAPAAATVGRQRSFLD
jgi:hypothetical protein